VPRSVLKGCEESFTAADEHQTKASTQFFTDTGLMALLCRHDQVLWLVNMTTAGERQYFALVLIRMLFCNLPSWVIIGALYDVGCIFHQSLKIESFGESQMPMDINGHVSSSIILENVLALDSLMVKHARDCGSC
ncbi:hypothetical protein C8J56DRAFT_785017, partial [Mycena floridula]